jgi:hypothetical protein
MSTGRDRKTTPVGTERRVPPSWSCHRSTDWTFRPGQQRLTVAGMSTNIRPDLVDRMIELYCDWRTACWDVRSAYERFLAAPAPDRAVSFAAYAAALDQEESACEAYAAQIRAIQSRDADADADADAGTGAHSSRSHANLR